MPNWCENNVKISGEKVQDFVKFLEVNKGKDWFDFFLPCPKDLIDTVSGSFSDEDKQKALIVQQNRNLKKYGHADWYSWCCENWGTKWNCDAGDFDVEGDSVRFSFESAWAPPTELYRVIEEQGFTVVASYMEEGMSFVGEYCDGSEDTYNYTYNDLASLDNVPEYLVAEYDLRTKIEENIEQCETEDEE